MRSKPPPVSASSHDRHRKAVEQAISRLYGNEGTARVIEEMKREAGSSSDVIPAQMAQDTADPQESAPTIRFVNALIERAYTERASDIHLSRRRVRWWCGCASMVCSAAS